MEQMLTPLSAWFCTHRRSFPWREEVSPYRVLVSEIMLQQTQASRVIPFFSRWMEQWPTPHHLAYADEATVIKAWEGLGYYSRARSLQATAKLLVAEYGGAIPNDERALRSLPGIGPYTAGAIRAFAFHERAVAIDANVNRVMARLMPDMSLRTVPDTVERLLPPQRPWETMEALIELGALVCKPTPVCSACPLTAVCHAHATHTQERTLAKRRIPRTSLWRDVAVFVSHGTILVTHRTGRQVMAGLFEFPYFESAPQGTGATSLIDRLQSTIPSRLSFIAALPTISHTFTRYSATLYPYAIACDIPFSWPQGEWVSLQSVSALPFSSGHKRVLTAFLSSMAGIDLRRSASLAYL